MLCCRGIEEEGKEKEEWKTESREQKRPTTTCQANDLGMRRTGDRRFARRTVSSLHNGCKTTIEERFSKVLEQTAERVSWRVHDQSKERVQRETKCRNAELDERVASVLSINHCSFSNEITLP